MKIHGTYPPKPDDIRASEAQDSQRYEDAQEKTIRKIMLNDIGQGPFTNKELFEIRDALAILIKYYNFVDLHNEVEAELKERQEITLESLNEDKMKEGMK